MTNWRARIPSLAVALGLSTLVFVDACNLIFGCGCDSLWSGVAAGCNIHHAAGPHCPWCEHPLLGGAVAYFAVALFQAAAMLSPGRLSRAWRLALAMLGLPVVGAAVGWIQGWLWGYWG